MLQAMLPLLIDANDVDRELAVRRALFQLMPRNRGAADDLVDALARAGHAGEAAQLLEQRLRDEPGDRVPLGLRLAEMKEAAGDDDGAARVLTELRARVPRTAIDRRRTLWMRALDVERRRGRLPELAHELARAPGGVEWEVLSHVRDELGDPEAALTAARRATALDPRNAATRRWTVSLLERLGHQEAAIAEFEALSRSFPRDVRFVAEVIERRFRRGDNAQAQAVFDRALARFGGDAAALTVLAQLAAHWSEETRAIAAWQRLRHISPGDEAAIVGLGELYFQRGKKESALRTWRELVRLDLQRPVGKVQGYLRLADVLMEHELLDEARATATQAHDIEPKHPGPHRAFAQILERRHRIDAAIAEWEKVLELCTGPEQAGARYEARSRILALAARDGRSRLAQRQSRLEEEWRQHPQDRELALFLAEAQQRNGSLPAAIATLRAVIERDQSLPDQTAKPELHPRVSRDAQADVITTLVRLLRQTRQLDEAVAWLQRLATNHPTRAKEAQLQIADIELGRYDDEAAIAHAQAAERLATGDSQALARIGLIEERAGRDEQALATYRRAAAAQNASAAATLGIARIIQRRGNVREASQILRALLRNSTEEDVINEAGHSALDLEEYLGTREDFARTVAILAVSDRDGAVYRRLFVDLLRRLVPALYHASHDGGSDGGRAAIAQRGLRPLLETIAESEGPPEPGLVELLGMLGNPDATLVLARLAADPTEPAKPAAAPAGGHAVPAAVTEAQRAAVIALGRLRDERGRTVLEPLAAAPDSALRAAALWGLGRIANPPPAEFFLKALADRNDEAAALACLALGRLRDGRLTATLIGVARDLTRAPLVRRAALDALGLSGDRGATRALASMLDSGAPELDRAAAVALAAIGDGQAVGALLADALSGGMRGGEGERPTLVALDRIVHSARPGGGAARAIDDGQAIDGTRIAVDAILDALEGPADDPAGAADGSIDRSPIWVDRPQEIARLIARGLAADGESRRRLLAALDNRADGLGLGPLAPAGKTPLAPASAEALAAIAVAIQPALTKLFDDADPEVRARAVRVTAKTAPAALPVDQIRRLTADTARLPQSLSSDAAADAARLLARHAPASTAALADQVTPLLRHQSWEIRLAAVRVLLAAGKATRSLLSDAASDAHPLVRAAAGTALAASFRETEPGD